MALHRAGGYGAAMAAHFTPDGAAPSKTKWCRPVRLHSPELPLHLRSNFPCRQYLYERKLAWYACASYARICICRKPSRVRHKGGCSLGAQEYAKCAS